MKKILLLLVMPLALIGCKQKSAETTDGKDTIATDTVVADTVTAVKSFAKIAGPECEFFSGVRGLDSRSQLQWLKDNAEDICDKEDYLECLVNYHLITEVQFNDAIEDFWGTNTPVYTTFDYDDFTKDGCDFDKFFVFKANTSNVISYELKTFDISGFNYSKPFFKGIPLVFTSVVATSDLKFTQGKIGTQNVIIFKIDGVTDAYFDFSQHPCGNQ